MKKRSKFISIRLKITIMTLVMTVVGIVSMSVFSYLSYRNDSLELQSNIALAAAGSVVAAVDTEKYIETAASGNKNNYYYQIKDVFDTARENTDMMYIYTFVKADDGINYRNVYVSGDENFIEFDTIESYGAPPLEAYRTGENTVSSIYENGDHGYMISAFAPIIDDNGDIVGLVGADISADEVMHHLVSYKHSLIFAGISFILIFTIVTSYYTSRSLGKPIKLLAMLAKRIVDGELDVETGINTNDEIHLLADNFLQIRDTLNMLVSSIHNMSEAHINGQLDYFTDCAPFTGVYQIVVKETNDMVREYVNNVWDILGTIIGFGKGDFNIALRELPGQKNFANEAVEVLRTIFIGLSLEIGELAVSSANGDLSKKIDTDKYDGDWRVLTEGLNNLLEAIRNPISESVSIIRQMAEGDFGGRVKGDYKGDFSLIKNSLNATMDKISLYTSEISDVLSKMSEQNLNIYIDREYIGDFSRIKASINMIIEKFNYVLLGIISASDKVASEAKQISDTSVSMAQGASEQATATEELSASVEQIAIQTDNNSDTANRANDLASSVKRNVEIGNNEMKALVLAMEEISESSSSISKINKTIDDIAFQTNLLALNAAVEAARAGIHGKGFAVVAEEVRSLASRSKIAAQETSSLIEDSIKKASEGMRVSEDMAKSLEAIVKQISEVSEQIGGIAEASQEQSANIGLINQGITQISQVTQSSSALSEESAAASEELSRQANLLRDEVAKFELRRS